MISAVLIDDEFYAIDVLTQLLKNFTNTPVKVLGTANNLEEGIKIINSTKPDIVFLDIDMPNGSGMDIFKFFKKPEFKIIFVTAYNQYAIEALKNSATDYLLKPIDFNELSIALSKVALILEQEQKQRETCKAVCQLESTMSLQNGSILNRTEIKSAFSLWEAWISTVLLGRL